MERFELEYELAMRLLKNAGNYIYDTYVDGMADEDVDLYYKGLDKYSNVMSIVRICRTRVEEKYNTNLLYKELIEAKP